ncbi:histidine-specific methyltransferase [Peziza echinospora]|nr:histidine-specific methyltransferase [Peziza echinospora]
MAPHKILESIEGRVTSSAGMGKGAAIVCPYKIIDIRPDKTEVSLKKEIASCFLDVEDGGQGKGGRALPTMLLYDAEGLKLFERITYLDEYYLTGAEIGILEKWAGSMARRIPDGGVVVELGSGNLRKVSILLHALAAQGKSITYYALDLSRPELERTLADIPSSLPPSITCVGLHGCYDDGLKWLSTNPQVKDVQKCILWLGSSIGNFDRTDATAFLRDIADKTMMPGDTMLIGIDGCKIPEKVFRAYNDSFGVSREFELNGLAHANEILGGDVFKKDEWEYVGEWNERKGRHQAVFIATRDVVMDEASFGRPSREIRIRKGERVKIERSYKFDAEEVGKTWVGAGLVEGARWGCETGDYNLHMVYKPPFNFPLNPMEYAKYPQPTLAEWRELWNAWDMVTLKMISPDRLLSKPIDLRNPCIFYLGHIPTFLDMHINIATRMGLVSSDRYVQIFERGIDPDVENPEQCHRHSEAPSAWPPVSEILDFQNRVRERVVSLYDANGEDVSWGSLEREKKVLRRELWLGFEHEAMHLETLLYMLLQSPHTLPPAGIPAPDYEVEGHRWAGQKLENPWVDIPASTIDIGRHDPESDDDDDVIRASHHFGWDNEKPLRTGVRVHSFQARAAPISVGEYVDYLAHLLSTTTCSGDITALPIPASWEINTASLPLQSISPRTQILESFSLKTMFKDPSTSTPSKLPLTNPFALTLPIVASYDELAPCARFLGGRIPTQEELLSVYQHAEGGPGKGGSCASPEQADARMISAVNGEMNGNGVFESPPPSSSSFAETLQETNVGFCSGWGFSPVRSLGSSPSSTRLRGRGQTGGAWEWTASVLARWDGFVEQRTYGEYTRDFFDGKHNVVLGGGWATVPRIAGRGSFVNWYQRSYRYMWCTARVVRDIDGHVE